MNKFQQKRFARRQARREKWQSHKKELKPLVATILQVAPAEPAQRSVIAAGPTKTLKGPTKTLNYPVNRKPPQEHFRSFHFRTCTSGKTVWVRSTIVNIGIK